ncbi:MAG TPA: ATP-binding protein, partial [Blastocatellia bacterium]|nr:ATP-binding protein [Blastocatellia bacterium]
AKPCLYVKSFAACYGTDHDRIRQVFKQARKTAPCIVVLEDLDSLIDDDNRSFFLNELDGFAENTGVVVLATTNHPDRLDPAILDRPSRFDRKYYFQLPSADGRLTYLKRWRDSVQPELRFSDLALRKTVEISDDFSFAYLKELCVSAMMEWMAASSNSMDQILCMRATLLRKEMKDKSGSKRTRKAERKKAKAARAGCERWS